MDTNLFTDHPGEADSMGSLLTELKTMVAMVDLTEIADWIASAGFAVREDPGVTEVFESPRAAFERQQAEEAQ